MKYAKQRIRMNVCEWLRFTKHCADAGIDLPSSIYAREVEDYLRQRVSRAGRWRLIVRTALRIFIEADHQGNFPRHICAQPKPSTEIFTEWVIPYLRFLREHRGLAEATLQLNGLALRKFTEFVERSGIRDLSRLNVRHIHDFCSNPGSYKPTTWLWCMSNVRCFLKYVFSQEGLSCDLSPAVGGAKHFRHAGLPDVLTESEVNKILDCMDRSSPLGLRGYAVLLLAACYGMRPSDIRRLRLDDIRWREGTIVFHQSKTGKPVTLPLLPDVSDALIEYLRAGRPSTASRHIFVRHRAPFEAFAHAASLCGIMLSALHRAGLDQRPGSRGLYLFRHTLATRLLGAHVSTKTIGDILGHTSTESTFIYTKVDVGALRSASLSIAEVLS
jgi:integrase